jgi:RNA polymerase sigma-70 factor (ECF subfamily)
LNEGGNINQLTDHLFRRESAKMVSVLTKIFGTENLQTAEDVVQDTLLDAYRVWTIKGIPDNPSGWLFRVAKNKAIDIIRRNKYAVQYDFSDNEKILLTSGYTASATLDEWWKEELINDDLLRMMFACCHPAIAAESQVTLILKTLCGFSTAEIAKAFLTGEDTVSKRLYRTKEFFRQHKVKLEIPAIRDLKLRNDAVLNSIYLLFNEGYNSTSSASLIRTDLMEEAMRLCSLLIQNRYTQLPETNALMALMYFQSSRNGSRLSDAGEIILLPGQDRSKWDIKRIVQGNYYMQQAATGDTLTVYHLQAAIAFEHCSAQNFESTNWVRMLELYDWLCRISSSPIAELNRVVAILKVRGADMALSAINSIYAKGKMEQYYLYHCVLAEIQLALNQKALAKQSYEMARVLTQSEVERRMLQDKLNLL